MSHSWEFPRYYDRRSLEVLERSLSQVSAYRSWQACDPGREHPVASRYAVMPALTKRDIRAHSPESFVPGERDVRRGLDNGEISFVKTSGSSDVSVTNIWNQEWWDASERASWKLNSHAARVATVSHPEAILANPLNVGIISDEIDLPMESRRLGHFLYLNEKTNPVTWSSELMDRMIGELEIFKPAVLEANPSLLAKLCRYAAAGNKRLFQPGLVVFTYEYPTQFHYRQVRQVFSAPTASSYGTTETGYVFMQCEEGKFHQNSKFCRVDFQPLKSGHGGPLVGRILITTFGNPWYYMVRFDVGDLVSIDEEGKCPCGRDSGYILSAIEGRATNLTQTCGGQLVTLRKLDDALSVLAGIDEYRLEQVSRGFYNLYLVTQRPDRMVLSQEASEILKGLYGQEAEVSIIYQEALSPEDSGKFCASKALFPIDIESYLDEGCLPR